MQKRRNSIAYALELRLFCIKSHRYYREWRDGLLISHDIVDNIPLVQGHGPGHCPVKAVVSSRLQGHLQSSQPVDISDCHATEGIGHVTAIITDNSLQKKTTTNIRIHIDVLMHKRRNSGALAMELRLFCIKLVKFHDDMSILASKFISPRLAISQPSACE